MKLPRYDKVSIQSYKCFLFLNQLLGLKLLILTCFHIQSAFNGRGDRADPSTWPEVEGPLTVRGCDLELRLEGI